MNVGTLTPRSNDEIRAMRFSGNFGHPDGFESVLTVSIKKSGEVALTLEYKSNCDNQINLWSVIRRFFYPSVSITLQLTDGQRNILGAFLCRYQPRLYEVVEVERR